MNTFNITLDLNKGNVTTPIRLRQGDLDGTTITALILDHGATADLTGLSARFVMELPGGEHYYRKDATVGEGSVTVVINEEQAASVTGRTTRAYFQLLDGETVRASTGSVTVDILPDALEGHTVPADYDSAIQDAIDALDDAVENIADTVEDVLEDHPEWTTTVQDGAVTDAKLYQGADGILARNARLMYRLDNLLTATLPEGDSATATDAAKTPLAGLALYGRSTQDGTPTPSAPVPIVSVDGNLLDVARSGTRTDSGVTWTYNADGTVTVTGTATGNSWSHTSALEPAVTLPAGTYTANVSAPFGLVVQANGSQLYAGTNNAYTFTLSAESSVRVYARAVQGTTYTGETTGIMLTRGSIAYPYVPYGHAGLWAKRTSDASVYTVTPIDLGGHELRSLPDGTRDELTVGADGRVTLVQRVGSVDLGTLTWRDESTHYSTLAMPRAAGAANLLCDAYPVAPASSVIQQPNKTIKGNTSSVAVTVKNSDYSSLSAFVASLSGTTLLYALATPQTIDLGWTDAIPLCGPDLTAQAVPTAPFALTYERDLNATLARLEAALAALA